MVSGRISTLMYGVFYRQLLKYNMLLYVGYFAVNFSSISNRVPACLPVSIIVAERTPSHNPLSLAGQIRTKVHPSRFCLTFFHPFRDIRCRLSDEHTASSRFILHGTMVVLLDLDDDDALDPFARPKGRPGLQTPPQSSHESMRTSLKDVSQECANTERAVRPNPNINGFSAALGCYP